MEEDFEVLEQPLISNNDFNSYENPQIFQPISFVGKEQQNFINDLYKRHHGASTRIPGGNCVFESVLAFMDNEQINFMINTVEHFIDYFKKTHDEKSLNDIEQIFQNTPNSKYGDLCAYMRAYVYLYLRIKEEKGVDCKDRINELVNGSYITPTGAVLSAFRRLTGCDILRINTENFQPILVSKNDKKAFYKPLNLDNQRDNQFVQQALENLKPFNENTETSTVQPAEVSFDNTDHKIIPLFFSGRHCTPAVNPNDKDKSTQINLSKFNMKYHIESKPSLLIPLAGTLTFALALSFIPIFPPASILFACTGTGMFYYASYKTIKTDENNKKFKFSRQQIDTSTSSLKEIQSVKTLKIKLKEIESEAKKQSITQNQQIYTNPNQIS